MSTPPVAREDSGSGRDIDATGRRWFHLHVMVCLECLELFQTAAAGDLGRKLLLTGSCGHNYVWVLKPDA